MPFKLTNYPPNWKSEIVPRIRKRAGDKCEKCGIANGDIVYAVPLKLQNERGYYRERSLWFTVYGDALRAAGFNKDKIKEVKVVLSVCHLDHDESNWSVTDDRLMLMCQIDHINNDAPEKYQRQQAGQYGKVLNEVKQAV